MKNDAYATPAPHIECAFAGCPRSAKIRVKTKTGWANVCLEHDVAIVKKRADAYCKSLGLETVEQKRAWLTKHGVRVKRAPVVEREPGEDLEEAECPL